MTSRELEPEPLSCTIVVLGDSFVGKTALIRSYATKEFSKTSNPTHLEKYAMLLGVASKGEEHIVSVVLADTFSFGLEKQMKKLLATADVAIICYSCVGYSAFDNVASIWYPELKTTAPDIPFILVGTKVDETWHVFDGRKVARKLGAYAHLECSAKDYSESRGERGDVDMVFNVAIEAGFKKYKSNQNSGKINMAFPNILKLNKFKRRPKSRKNQAEMTNPLPKSLQDFFGNTESLWVAGVHQHPRRANAWKRFMNFVSGKLSKEKQLLLLTFKAGVYMVLRLNEAVGSLFKSHPLRGRGSMLLSILAMKYSRLIENEIEKSLEKTPTRRNSEDWVENGGLNQDTGTSFGSKLSQLYRIVDRSQSNNKENTIRLDGAPSFDSKISNQSENPGSIHSALSIFSHSLQEKEESSVRSGSSNGSTASDDFVADSKFRILLNEILEKQGYFEVKSFVGNLSSLKAILRKISDAAAAYVRNIWKESIFTARNAEETDSVCLVKAILEILHEMNEDFCGSRVNQFQHSRFVGQMQRLKSRTLLTEGTFEQWIAVSGILNRDNGNRFHPTAVLKSQIRAKRSEQLYNTQEVEKFRLYHKKKARGVKN